MASPRTISGVTAALPMVRARANDPAALCALFASYSDRSEQWAIRRAIAKEARAVSVPLLDIIFLDKDAVLELATNPAFTALAVAEYVDTRVAEWLLLAEQRRMQETTASLTAAASIGWFPLGGSAERRLLAAVLAADASVGASYAVTQVWLTIPQLPASDIERVIGVLSEWDDTLLRQIALHPSTTPALLATMVPRRLETCQVLDAIVQRREALREPMLRAEVLRVAGNERIGLKRRRRLLTALCETGAGTDWVHAWIQLLALDPVQAAAVLRVTPVSRVMGADPASLLPFFTHERADIRGEAVVLLGILSGTREAPRGTVSQVLHPETAGRPSRRR